jgi:glycosyltransferase involved in cell wall biosynthesis
VSSDERSVLAAAPVVPARTPAREHREIVELLRGGPAPLIDAVPGMADREALHVATLLLPFRRGGGGHNIICQIVHHLERLGHTCSIWLDDPFRLQGDWPAVVRQELIDHFAPIRGPVFKGFDHWYGADVVLATGWQTVYPAMLLDGCRARAYLVNDHEPEFYPTSFDSHWAERTYELGLYSIAGSPWLRDLLAERYGMRGGSFDFGVDHDVYRPRPVERRRDAVMFYARAFTPRRAVELGVLALEELKARRPQLEVFFFGDHEPLPATIPYGHLGVLSHEDLSWAFSEATVGLCLSMTNYSLVPKEMLACGLPCVELDFPAARSAFGSEGPLALAPFDPLAVADALERLLADGEHWRERSDAGRAFVQDHTWDRAARQVELGLREALRERERGAAAAA